MATASATTETKSKFGVPTVGASGAGIMMPKQKNKFRVSFLNNFGGASETKVLTQNVMTVVRPKIAHEEVPIDSYNSRTYIQGKHTWEQTTVVFRDDITNQTTKLIGAQEQRQINHFQQTSPVAGSDYKFDMQIEVLDGTNAGSTEVWFLEGCFFTNVDYGDSDYTTGELVIITTQIRFDNAIHFEGDNDSNGRVVAGSPFPDTVDTNISISS